MAFDVGVPFGFVDVSGKVKTEGALRGKGDGEKAEGITSGRWLLY
jgi:hypothetical protein